jgi:hypothetical protein
MASNGALFSAPSRHLGPPSSAQIEQLEDDLSIQQAVLASLKYVPDSPSKQDQIANAKTEIGRLNKLLAEARHGRPTGAYIPLLPPLSKVVFLFIPLMIAAATPASTAAMHGSTRNHMPYVPSPSSMSTPSTSNSVGALPSRPHLPSRKRSYSSMYLDFDQSGSSDYKSRRTTPSPMATALTTPSSGFDPDFADDSMAVIDLTGYKPLR